MELKRSAGVKAMGVLALRIVEYPDMKEVQLDELTATGAASLIEECRVLLVDLEEIAHGK
jgi:hypothetical protein